MIIISVINMIQKNYVVKKMIDNTNKNELKIFKEKEKLLVSKIKLFNEEIEKERGREKNRISHLKKSQNKKKRELRSRLVV